MKSGPTTSGRVARTVGLLCLALAAPACTWQGYAVSRGLRTVTGTRTQLHEIVPIPCPLRTYRVIEVRPLENLAPGMPSELEQYLNDTLAAELHHVSSSPAIVRRDLAAIPEESTSDAPANPTLVLTGFIDDYDPGYLGLRLVELGLNHQVVTVRIQIEDKATGALLGAASITSQDNRAIGTAKQTIGRLALRIREFVGVGYGR